MVLINTTIDNYYSENKGLLEYLYNNKQPSFQSLVDDNFRKNLLLAAASYFEYQILKIIEEFIASKSANNVMIVAFLKNKAINRQFHTFFSWDKKNVNTFFGLFGQGFLSYMKKEVESDQSLHDAIIAFMEICSIRNNLVHENYASFVIEKTADETYEAYRKAVIFINLLRDKLEAYSEISSKELNTASDKNI